MERTGPTITFFRSPETNADPRGECILSRLRRDLLPLYGNEDEFDGDLPEHALLAAMGMLVGVDYLGSAYSNTLPRSPGASGVANVTVLPLFRRWPRRRTALRRGSRARLPGGGPPIR